MASACRSPIDPALTVTPVEAIIVNDLNDPAWPSDPITLDSAAVTPEGRIRLFTRYGGGCADHAAALLVDGAFMESQPPVLRARIAHNAKNDLCKALVSRTFEFALQPLRDHYGVSYQSSVGSLIVDIGGRRVTYSFP